MNRKTLMLIITLSITLISCSDNLSTSKAESLIEGCLKKDPQKITKIIRIGDNLGFSEEDLILYKSLEKKGLVKIVKKQRERFAYFDSYTLSLTDKSKEFVEETVATPNNSFQSATIRLCNLELEKVISVHELPSLNTAEVKYTLIRKNKTPFFDELTVDKTEFVTKNVIFTKTSEGWSFCE